MPKITLEVTEELAEQLLSVGDRLPELLQRSLQQPVIPSRIYSYILGFLASQPSRAQIAAFKPTKEMTEQLQTLLKRNKQVYSPLPSLLN